jgi:hypothetical protein
VILPKKRPLNRGLLCLSAVIALALVAACRRGSTELSGWKATRRGMELSLEPDGGPQGEPGMALLYTIVTGEDYAIERDVRGLDLIGPSALTLQARATRVLHLALVLVDAQGNSYECARTLRPGDWRSLEFGPFMPPAPDWGEVRLMRLEDRTGGLGGQGPVSLKLVGLPL